MSEIIKDELKEELKEEVEIEEKKYTNYRIRHLLIMATNIKEVINDDFAIHIKRIDGDTITEIYENSEKAFISFKQIANDIKFNGFIYLEQ